MEGKLIQGFLKNKELIKIVGIKGDKGDKGDSFTFDDLTPEQKDSFGEPLTIEEINQLLNF